MEDLRNLLDPNTPVVVESTWDRLAREGWRWSINLCLVHTTNTGYIRDRISVHGPLNVAVGHSFDKNAMKPRPETGWCGVYVRDVDIQVEQFVALLQDDTAVARWLSETK